MALHGYPLIITSKKCCKYGTEGNMILTFFGKMEPPRPKIGHIYKTRFSFIGAVSSNIVFKVSKKCLYSISKKNLSNQKTLTRSTMCNCTRNIQMQYKSLLDMYRYSTGYSTGSCACICRHVQEKHNSRQVQQMLLV